MNMPERMALLALVSRASDDLVDLQETLHALVDVLSDSSSDAPVVVGVSITNSGPGDPGTIGTRSI